MAEQLTLSQAINEALPKFTYVLKRDAEAASNMLYGEGEVGLPF